MRSLDTRTWGLAAEIRRMTDQGMRPAKIALALKICPSRVRRLAKRFSIPIPRAHQRRFGVMVREADAVTIEELARRAGVSPAEMMAAAVRAIAGEGTEIAARRLGKSALPKRGAVR